MKNVFKICTLIGCVFLFQIGKTQDWVQAAPEDKKILVDNDHFRMVEITLQPGRKEALHSHPEYIEYFLESGKMIVTYPEKKPVTWNVEKGKAYSGKPEPPHTIENNEKQPIKLLLVEMKDRPYKTEK